MTWHGVTEAQHGEEEDPEWEGTAWQKVSEPKWGEERVSHGMGWGRDGRLVTNRDLLQQVNKLRIMEARFSSVREGRHKYRKGENWNKPHYSRLTLQIIV